MPKKMQESLTINQFLLLHLIMPIFIPERLALI